MPKKLRTIAKNTDKGRRQRSKKIDISLKKVGKKKPKRWDHWNAWFLFQAKSQNTRGKTYDVMIQTIEDVGVTEDNWKSIAKGNIPMSVHCGCPDFKYRLEVALNKAGNSMIRDSNGKNPDITNPHMKAFLCKHALAAYDLLQKVVRQTDFENVKDIKTQKYYNK